MTIKERLTTQSALDRFAVAGVLVTGALIFVGGYAALALPVLVIGFLAVVYVPVDVWMSAAIALTIFSGNSSLVGFPFPPDRALFALSLLMLLVGAPLHNDRERVLKGRGVHVALILAAAYATGSAFWVGTISEERALFQLVDRFGYVPFLVFTLAPIVYGTVRSRRVLLSFLTGTGFYLAVVGWLEAFDLRNLVWPGYINDPNVGLHFERARGPFIEGTGMGTGLFACSIAAMVGVSYFRTPSAQRFAKFTAFAAMAATVFTLTRSIWLGTAVSIIVTMASDAKLRRAMIPVATVASVGVLIALVSVPQLTESFDRRANQQETVWDRVNLNRGAMNAFQDKPVTGIGWGNWVKQSDRYLEQDSRFPITGLGFEIHSLLLSHLAQLGIVGLALFVTAMGMAVIPAIFRRTNEEMKRWRLGLLAISIQWAIVILFTPGSFQFGTLLLWLFAGICSQEHVSLLSDPKSGLLDLRGPEPIDQAVESPA